MQLESSARKNNIKLLKKDDVLYFRTKFWARMVVFNAGFINNYKKMQKLFSPEKFVSGQSQPKDWEGYYKGLVKQPLRRTVDKTNDLIPNSEKIFDMPLWEIFCSEITTDKQIEKLVFNIKDIRIFNRIIKKEINSSTFHLRTRNLSKTIEYLVCQSTFDALNALTILLLNLELRNYTHINNKLKYKESIMSAILEVLIIMSVSYPIKKCFAELFSLFNQRFSYDWFQGDSKMLLYSDYKWSINEIEFTKISELSLDVVNSAKILKVVNEKNIVKFLFNFNRSDIQIKKQVWCNYLDNQYYGTVANLYKKILMKN